MDTAERFGRNIKRERLARDLTQEDLGQECDLHPTEIGRLERGVRDPRLSTIAKVARGLRLTPADLLGGVR